jgi:hypothetical protein
MPTEADPKLGYWYEHLDKGQRFCIVAFNEEQGLIEVQHFDGDLEEIDLETWYQLDLNPSPEPENWSGALDVGDIDDLGTEVTDTTADDWNAPLQELRIRDESDGDLPEDEDESAESAARER